MLSSSGCAWGAELREPNVQLSDSAFVQRADCLRLTSQGVPIAPPTKDKVNKFGDLKDPEGAKGVAPCILWKLIGVEVLGLNQPV